MTTSRSTLAILAVLTLGCSSDRATDPGNPLATRLSEVADSTVEDDYRIASALYAAAAMVEAGGRVSTIRVVVDSEPRTFNAVAYRVSFSRAVCDQLKGMFMDYGADSAGGFVRPEYDPCQPTQSLIAWEGDAMRRVALIQGDTGTNSLRPDTYDSWNFYGELYDREAGSEWWLQSGSQSNSMVREGGVCRAKSIPEQGVDFTCRLVTLRQSFDLVLVQYPQWDFDSLVVITPDPDVRRDTAFTDSVFVDPAYTWEQYPTHTLAMASHVVNGLSMVITKLDFDRAMGKSVRASARKSARFRSLR